jgi:hypothetical protein
MPDFPNAPINAPGHGAPAGAPFIDDNAGTVLGGGALDWGSLYLPGLGGPLVRRAPGLAAPGLAARALPPAPPAPGRVLRGAPKPPLPPPGPPLGRVPRGVPKAASGPVGPPAPPPPGLAENNALKERALWNVLATLGVSAVAGAGARALLGRRYLFGRGEPPPPPKTTSLPSVVPLPYPVYQNSREEEKARARGLVVAAAAAGPTKQADTAPGAGLLSRTLGLARRHNPAQAGQPGFDAAGTQLPNRWRGDGIGGAGARLRHLPWYWPAFTAAGLGGAAGGYALTDWWLDRQRRQDLQEDVEDARRDYEAALLSEYDPGRVHAKAAGVTPATPTGEALGRELDGLADAVEAGLAKEALFGTLQDAWASAPGAVLTLASLLALGGGYAGYRWSKDRSRAQLLNEAWKRRERERLKARPAELVAVPMPVRLTRGNDLAPVAGPPAASLT